MQRTGSGQRTTQSGHRWALPLVVVVVLLFGTTVSPAQATTEEAPQALVVSESGFGERGRSYPPPRDGDAGGRQGTSVVVLTNPNAASAAELVQLRVVLYAVDGTTLATREHVLPQVLPGESRALVNEWTIATTEATASYEPLVTTVAVEGLTVARWLAVRPVPLLTVTDVRVSGLFWDPVPRPGEPLRMGGFIPTVTGRVQNPLDAAIGELVVSAVAYDREGRVIGGGASRLAILGPLATQSLGKLPLVVSDAGPSPVARVVVSVAYPWIDLTPYRP